MEAPEQKYIEAGIYELFIYGSNKSKKIYQRDYKKFKNLVEEFTRLVKYYSDIDFLNKVSGIVKHFNLNTLNEDNKREFLEEHLNDANKYIKQYSLV